MSDSPSRRDKREIRYFVSYAHQDAPLKDDLLRRLEPRLKIAARYSFQGWQDGHIRLDQQWRAAIGQAITGCDFGLLLLSPHFLASDFINESELPHFVSGSSGMKQSAAVALETISFDGNIDLKGLESHQIFRDSRDRAYDRLRGSADRNQFAQQLFNKIVEMLDAGSTLAAGEPSGQVARPRILTPRETPPVQPADAALADLAVFRDAPFAPELVAVPAGEFWMGSPDGEKERFDDEGPRHRVTIGRRFAIGRYPVTFGAYDRFCAAKRREKPEDQGWGRDRRPAINVSWEDARAYVAWLSQETGKGYRLPSEAEWEYACRAGTVSRYSFGDAIAPKEANYAESNLGRTSEIGAYPPNPWRLCEMHGNVWEWVEDDWHDNYQGAPDDGSAWSEAGADSEDRRFVVRGGSWSGDPRVCRSAFRSWSVAVNRSKFLGFRVARTLD